MMVFEHTFSHSGDSLSWPIPLKFEVEKICVYILVTSDNRSDATKDRQFLEESSLKRFAEVKWLMRRHTTEGLPWPGVTVSDILDLVQTQKPREKQAAHRGF